MEVIQKDSMDASKEIVYVLLKLCIFVQVGGMQQSQSAMVTGGLVLLW